MGAYLSDPITKKETEAEESAFLRVVSSSMQGWRVTQEDAHNAILDFDKGSSLFAVYDGHGGHEVAVYTAQNLPSFIKENPDYKGGNVEKALIDSFVEFDRTITSRDVVNALRKIAGTKAKEDDEAEPEELDDLCEEATMPIEEVMAKYADEPGVKHPRARSLVVAGTSKLVSPFLKAKRRAEGCSQKEEEEEDSKKVPEAEANGDAEHTPGKVCEKEEEEVKTNGHNGKEVKEEVKVVNGDVKGKGKGKGKGKSSMIRRPAAAAEEAEAEPAEEKEPERKRQPKKTAEELYRNILNDDGDEEQEGEEEEEDSSDDEMFGGKEESDSDEDDDEQEDGDEDDEDTEDEDDEDAEADGEECIGGEFNEDPGNDSGCTAVVALLRGNRLFVANAGDSRCVVCRDGKAVEMSFDHKPEDEPELKRIEKAGGKVTPDGRVNGGLNLSRAIGDHAYKTKKFLPLTEQMISPVPDVRTLTLDPKKDSFVLLACDGIWNSMSSQEVVDFVSERIRGQGGDDDDGDDDADPSTDKLSRACEELFDNCLAPDTMGDGTGCDNMTAVLVKLRPAFETTPNPPSPVTEKLNSEDTASSNSGPKAPPEVACGSSTKRPASPEGGSTPSEDSKRPKLEEGGEAPPQSS